jgi:hypothetical protein
MSHDEPECGDNTVHSLISVAHIPSTMIAFLQ